MKFCSHFEALNDDFWENRELHGAPFNVSHIKSCSPWIDLSNEVLIMSNEDHMPKLRPREIDVPIYSNGAHSFGTSSLRVRILDV